MQRRRKIQILYFFQVKRQIGGNHAERNAPFIFWCVNEIFGANTDYLVSQGSQVYQTPIHQQGIYIFFIERGGRNYPIYIGITRRSFAERFTEHRNLNNGVIHQVVTGRFPQNLQANQRHQLTLKVKCIALDYPVIAKLMESVFLAAFDFCLNKEENGGAIRANIDFSSQFSVEQSKHDFQIIFDNIMRYITNIYNSYSNN